MTATHEPCESCGSQLLVTDAWRDVQQKGPNGEFSFFLDALDGVAMYEPHVGVDLAAGVETVALCWTEHTVERCRSAQRVAIARERNPG